jgi:hypothetical protein
MMMAPAARSATTASASTGFGECAFREDDPVRVEMRINVVDVRQRRRDELRGRHLAGADSPRLLRRARIQEVFGGVAGDGHGGILPGARDSPSFGR